MNEESTVGSDVTLVSPDALRRLTRKCSRQAEVGTKFRSAQRPVGPLRNVGWCGHGPEGLQLICMSLGSNARIIEHEADGGGTLLE